MQDIHIPEPSEKQWLFLKDKHKYVAYGGARKSFLIAQGMEFSWLTILAVIILVLAWFVLYKTRFGLRLFLQLAENC